MSQVQTPLRYRVQRLIPQPPGSVRWRSISGPCRKRVCTACLSRHLQGWCFRTDTDGVPVLSASRVIAAPVGGIGAPRCPVARQSVSSIRLKCSTPRFDRSDGPSRASLKGAGSPAAVIVGLIPGRAAVVPRRRQRYSRTRNLGSSFSVQFRHIQLFVRPCASAVDRPDAGSEASRGAVAPEPKERF